MSLSEDPDVFAPGFMRDETQLDDDDPASTPPCPDDIVAPGPLSPPLAPYNGRWNDEGEDEGEGEHSGSVGDEGDTTEDEESDDYSNGLPNSRGDRSREPLPKPTLPMLLVAQQMIEDIKQAHIEDDIDDDELLNSLRNPPVETEPIDAITKLSFRIFIGLIGGSQHMYNAVRDALLEHSPDLQLHSYHVIRKKAQNITGISQIRTDMCPQSCLAYTGPFSSLTECPTCGTPRYKDTSVPTTSTRSKKPRKQFYTIPLGPQLQALWRTPDGADRMRYRNRKTNEIMAELRNNGNRISVYEDVFHGSAYLQAVCERKIGQDDIFLMFSLDGAQLYRDKASDCWFSIWVILNLSPDLQYKKKYVLPGCFVPGPDSPDNMESFLLPAFRHVSALQKEGLRVWDGRQQKQIISRPFFGYGAADTVALPILSGLVGHNGSLGCRVYCGMPGRRKPGNSKYYPVALKPHNYDVDNCSHPDIDIRTLGSISTEDKYYSNLHVVLTSKSDRSYTRHRLNTGIVRPSICLGFQEDLSIPVPLCFTLDLMHLVSLNIPQLLLAIWRNTSDARFEYNGIKPDFIVLDDKNTWEAHGRVVASTHPYLPESFDRLPRDPSKKINSQYKASEFLLYFWALGPGLFRPILPYRLWTHFCKLVCGIRLVHQRRITENDVKRAHQMLTEWAYEYELFYYGRDANRLHLVRPCTHAVIHAAQETVRCGPVNLLAQWVLENTIGNLGREVHQHSNPFSNLAERGVLRAHVNALQALVPELDQAKPLPRGAIPLAGGYILLRARDKSDYRFENPIEARAVAEFLAACGETVTVTSTRRWARLRLPNGQLSRCRWKELLNRNTRNSRNVKVCTPACQIFE